MRTRRTTRSRGQALIETVLVMPLFLFIVLGFIQLTILYQARLMTKYAAYKAARAGALNRAEHQVMTNAAVSVMLPMLTRQNPVWHGFGGEQPQYAVYNLSGATGPAKFKQAFTDVIDNRHNSAFGGHPMVEVTICHPTRALAPPTPFDDFDDPSTNPMGGNNNWSAFERTKLSVQVTTYLNLYIPFANAILWWASYGEMDPIRADTMKTLRLNSGDFLSNSRRLTFEPQQPYTLAELRAQAIQGNYIMPVRASYSMRMHSNLSPDAWLPDTNRCHIPFFRK